MLTGTVGHYRIVRLLGSGGMGEVYLADDTKLGRQIALKVLPPELTADAGRRERFEREARAVAALNHPSIVTLHSIDQADATPFLTMEYVDGKALGELIPKSGMPLDRLLKIAIPLADAVGAAHQRGILHRDLKPANVMVTADGRVKVLDFGLAKLQEDVKATEALPTQELTGEGRIVGTVAYMSPEQAEGKAVDQRSDVFALGVLLYELATGQRPFTGDTSLSVLSAILKDAPRPVAELRPDLPRDFARIVKRALNKDPEERYQSAKDLRNDLHGVLDDLTSGELARPTPAVAAPARRGLTPMTIAAIASAAVAVGIAAWALATRSTSEAPSATASETWSPTRLTSSGLVRGHVAISPDGRYVAYAQLAPDGQGLWLRQVATNSEAVLRPPERVGFDGIAFSRDGNFVYYSVYPAGDNAATLYRIPAIGGTPQKILFNLDTSVAFSPDGTRMAFVVDHPSERRSTVEVAAADGTGRRVVAEQKRPNRFPVGRPASRLAWSPDGSTIAVAVIDGPGEALALIEATTGAMRIPGDKHWPVVNGAEWPAGGRELIVSLRDAGSSGSQLWRIDPSNGSGEPITHDLFNYAGPRRFCGRPLGCGGGSAERVDALDSGCRSTRHRSSDDNRGRGRRGRRRCSRDRRWKIRLHLTIQRQPGSLESRRQDRCPASAYGRPRRRYPASRLAGRAPPRLRVESERRQPRLGGECRRHRAAPGECRPGRCFSHVVARWRFDRLPQRIGRAAGECRGRGRAAAGGPVAVERRGTGPDVHPPRRHLATRSGGGIRGSRSTAWRRLAFGIRTAGWIRAGQGARRHPE